jgi:molecular chaperone GrpE
MNGQSEQTDNDPLQPATTDGDDAERTENGPAEAPVADQDPLAALQLKADENWDSYLRAAAELENVRKRAARDIDNARKFGLDRFATELLAVVDGLEMGILSHENADADQLRSGSEATLKLLATIMERFGVAQLDPLGEPFDPELHEAMTMQPSAEVEPGTVVTVYQKGYTLNGRLLRPARVVVAQEPQDAVEQ